MPAAVSAAFRSNYYLLTEPQSHAVMLCCEQLVRRLAPVRDALLAAAEPGAPPPSWEAIVKKAKGSVSLSSQAMLPKPAEPAADGSEECRNTAVSEACPNISKGYHNFGAAVSEVEIDVLTGEVGGSAGRAVHAHALATEPLSLAALGRAGRAGGTGGTGRAGRAGRAGGTKCR